jgi:hypothetical protein
MKTTAYFREQVLRKRPYIRSEWCLEFIANPIKTEIQPDGRVRFWGYIEGLGGKALWVVILEDVRRCTMRFQIVAFQGGRHEASLLC